MRKHPERPASSSFEGDCAAAEPRLEAYVDGELAAAESAAVEAHVEHCASCAAGLELTRRIAAELRALPPQECPPAVTATVLSHAEKHPGLLRRLAAWWAPRPAWRPALAALAVAVLVAGYLRLAPPGPAGAPEYSPAEVARAEAELKLALAYLGEIGATASETVSVDVIGQRVVRPVSETITGSIFPISETSEGENGGGSV